MAKEELNNRFSDVIDKMEEETYKIQRKRRSERTTEEKIKTKKTKSKHAKTTKDKEKNAKSKQETKSTVEVEQQEKTEEIEKDTIEDAKDGKEENKVEKNANNKLDTVKDDINVIKTLEAIKNEIKEETSLPKEKQKKVYARLFRNILFGMLILIYFISINICYMTLAADVCRTTLKVLSLVGILATVITFEIAYKKDNGKIAITGIELLIVSICTLLSIYMFNIYYGRFKVFVTSVGLLFTLYFVVKSIVIYSKEKRKNRIEEIENNKKETR